MANLKARNVEFDLAIPIGRSADTLYSTALHLLFDADELHRSHYAEKLVKVVLEYETYTHEITRK